MNAVTLSADLAALRPVVMKMTRRQRIEFIVDMLVTALDLIDGDVDLEDDDPDACEVREDQGTEFSGWAANAGHVGDPDDAEEDDPAEEDNEDRCCAYEDWGGKDAPDHHDAGAGDPADAEAEPDEDSDADEPSYIWVTTRSGRERMA